ncbi:hypothetical protein KP003_03515 [Geomonas nitrogeniifigens]|uniref:Uncharacterized protein n=1 Tax=Geomonas diazotrophica TaxID=2843197 RepID=A0ABX8JIT0_9BACT|nr:hypothetical protein [Geomonas nitrogeniifigens]QWV98299.1 hypothetical protein KP005_03150 [Geomonas nitrogeniifigens]QXE87483.1 hypothetical protein KP003_03515 [Geomonas nitrogeniifigens]
MLTALSLWIGLFVVAVVLACVRCLLHNSFSLTYGIAISKKELNNVNGFTIPPVYILEAIFDQDIATWKPSLIFKQVNANEILMKEKDEFTLGYHVKLGGPVYGKVKYDPYHLTLSLTCYCSLTFIGILLVVFFGLLPWYYRADPSIDIANLRLLVLVFCSPALLLGAYQVRTYDKVFLYLSSNRATRT